MESRRQEGNILQATVSNVMGRKLAGSSMLE